MGGRSRTCERCGSSSHPETTCHTWWRLYAYHTPEEHSYVRAKKYRHELRRQECEHAREKKQQKPKPGWAASLVMMPEDVDDDVGPSDDSSDSSCNSSGDADTNGAGRKRTTSSRNTVPLPPSDWDPALKVCYNCASVGHHWGDDCFLRRTNPTRPTGDPSPFSEVIANAGPYSQAYSVRDGSVRSHAPDLTIPPPPRRKRSRHSFSGRTSSLLEDLQNSGSTNKDDDDDDDDDDDWFARHQKLREQESYLSDTDDTNIHMRRPKRQPSRPRGSRSSSTMSPTTPTTHHHRRGSRGRGDHFGHTRRRGHVDRASHHRPGRPTFHPRYRGGYT